MTDHPPLPPPDPSECLPCYIDRTLDDVGCDNTLRLAPHYRDLQAPTDTELERRLRDLGGFCDCEILANAYQPHRRIARPLLATRLDSGDETYGVVPLIVLPACAGVAEGSTGPCANWEQVRRGR